MKQVVLISLCLVGSRLFAANGNLATTYPQYSLPHTECRVLPRTVEDRIYKLYIGLPPSFASHPERRYPVICVTDGYWAFPAANAVAGNLAVGKHIPESLVVGLSYEGENLDYAKLRATDLLPQTSEGKYEAEGHAERFLKMLETQVLPLLEKEYRADPRHRYLMGSSAGGLFGLYTMLSKPDLFQGFVVDSPWVLGLWNMERDFAATGRKTEARIYMTSAENEWKEYRKWIPIFYERMKQHGYVNGGLVYRETPGTRHSVAVAEVYMRGLMYVMEPLAPEVGVATDMLVPEGGKHTYLINFWIPGNIAPDIRSQAQRAHEAYAEKLIAEQRAQIRVWHTAGTTATGDTLSIDALNKTVVEAIAIEDPAVKTKSMDFEVLGD
jgi:hypothetical protein